MTRNEILQINHTPPLEFHRTGGLSHQRMYIGEEGEIDIISVTNNSIFGVLLNDLGDFALISHPSFTDAFSFTLGENKSGGYLLNISKCEIQKGTLNQHLKLFNNSDDINFPLQTNQSIGAGLLATNIGLNPFIICHTHGESVCLIEKKEDNLWAVSESPPLIEHWNAVQVVASVNPTTTTEFLAMRERSCSSETTISPLGARRVFDLVKELTNDNSPEPKKGFKITQETAKRYYKTLPKLVEQTAKKIITEFSMESKPPHPNTTAEQISNAQEIFGEKALEEVMINLSLLPENSDDFVNYFLCDLIPTVINTSSINVKGKYPENEAVSMKTALLRIINSYKCGKLNVFTILCPSYHYEVFGEKLDKKAQLRHYDGQILPTIGSRFVNTIAITAKIFGDLSQFFPQGGLTFSAYTYNGEFGTKGLWEMGQDVLDFYSGKEGGELELRRNLFNMFEELSMQTKKAFQGKNIEVEVLSLESSFIPEVTRIYNEFTQAFPDINMLDKATADYLVIDRWLKDKIGLGIEWFNYFYQEEATYAKKQRVGHEYNILRSALREALLYWVAQRKANNKNTLLWGLETTANYMVGSLPEVIRSLGPTAVIMAKPFNPIEINGFGIRQPFNIPIYSTPIKP